MSPTPTIEYWDLEEPPGGGLWHESPDDAIEMALDSTHPGPCPRTITIYGWARAELTRDTVGRLVAEAVAGVWESLDADYAHEQDDDTSPTPEGKAAIDAAASALSAAIRKHYPGARVPHR